jgi:hypothetical protein
MTEKVHQGREDPADAAARRIAWEDRDLDAANTSLTMEDIERVLMNQPGINANVIAQAKRDRGKPM